MVRVDPFISLRDWQLSLYRGEPAAIDRFLDAIDATLPPGWVRDRERERKDLRSDRVRCYVFDRPGDAAVRVWLERVTATRVRGSWVEVLRHPASGDAPRIGRLVAEVADDCVLPAAGAAGVRCTRPAFGPRSAITSAAKSLLTELADAGDGEWPLADRTDELLDDLISTGLAEHIGIDRAEFLRWLEDNGWEPEAAAALADRFYEDSRWLAKRLAFMDR